MASAGKMLILFGVILIVAGGLLMLFNKIPFLGKLPGDIHIKKENFEIYVPVTSSLILCLVLNGLMWLVTFLSKK